MFLVGLVGFVVGVRALRARRLPGDARRPAGSRRVCFGAVLIPQGFGIIKSMFPPRELGTAFGAFGPAIGLAAVAGPILGRRAHRLGPRRRGLAHDLPDQRADRARRASRWPAKVLPESRADGGPRPDPVGMLLVSTGLVLLIFPLVEGRELGWPGWTFAMMAASVPVLVLFALHQVRRRAAGRAPLVEPALFRTRAFTGRARRRARLLRRDDRARVRARPLPAARAGLHPAAGRARAGALGAGHGRRVRRWRVRGWPAPRTDGAAGRRGRDGAGARRRGC